MIYPVITLWQPWATWIMREWKTIETRTHDRFACLKGETILIHAGQTTDESAAKNPYLTKHQLLHKPEEVINGFILGSVEVWDFAELKDTAAKMALIECRTKRYGLFLENVVSFHEPIPAKGGMGIWYFDLDKQEKVKKPEALKLLL